MRFAFGFLLLFGVGCGSTDIAELPSEAQSKAYTHSSSSSGGGSENAPVFRTWRTDSGKFEVEAAFVSRSETAVELLRKDNGKVVTVPIAKLSESDKKFVDDIGNSSIELQWSKTDANGDCLVAYAVNRSLKLDEFIDVCKQAKDSPCGRVFTVVVLFDNAKNVSESNTPFSAAYGDDYLAGEVLKHIRAMYIHNKVNGFSELTRYQKNAFESKPIVSKL